MRDNQKKYTMEEILTELNSGKFKFQLTGSRYFCCDHKGSDWDFFVAPSQELYAYLGSLGFINMGASAYVGDPNVLTVFRHTAGTGVDVQVVPNPELKSRIQEYIRAHKTCRALLAANPSAMWAMCYALAGEFNAFHG